MGRVVEKFYLVVRRVLWKQKSFLKSGCISEMGWKDLLLGNVEMVRKIPSTPPLPAAITGLNMMFQKAVFPSQVAQGCSEAPDVNFNPVLPSNNQDN